ncbi:hypothetical protein ACFLYB_03235 [Chloroflexota bacterium]
MKVDGNKITLLPNEVSTTCPLNVKWASSMVAVYGPDSNLGGRLALYSRCPEVLRAAGYDVAVEGQKAVKE